MSDDLVKRLRQPECVYSEDKTIAFWFESTDKFDAAYRIEELERALREIIDVKYYGMEGAEMETYEMKSIARAVLEEKKDE